MLAVLTAALQGELDRKPQAQNCDTASMDAQQVATLKAVLSKTVPPAYTPVTVDSVGRIADSVRVVTIRPGFRPRGPSGGGKFLVYLYCSEGPPTQVGFQWALDDSITVYPTEAVKALAACILKSNDSTIQRSLVCLASGAWLRPESELSDRGSGSTVIITQSADSLPKEFTARYGSEATTFLAKSSASRKQDEQDWIAYQRISLASSGYPQIVTHALRVFRIDMRSPPSITLEAEADFGAQRAITE